MNAPDHALVVAHGARSLLLTGVVASMTALAAAAGPPAGLPWAWIVVAWAGAATLSFLWSRIAAGGVVPPGAWGDVRLALAFIGMLILTAVPDVSHDGPPPFEGTISAPAALHDWGAATVAQGLARVVAPVPFVLLLAAALLCGLADGAWNAMAQRHMKLSSIKALVLFVRAIRSGDATSWRIVTGGRP
ncbi:MAG: hypothetical protein OXK73_03335 [Rhodospirillaceae bacterium]|nr:hypothetical protein [Rhodospirillaceae bacterium]